MFADGQTFLCGLLLLLRADFVSTPALQTFPILLLHIMRALLARDIARRTAGSAENGNGANKSDEQFHFNDSISFAAQ
jgi:hypothetical protein